MPIYEYLCKDCGGKNEILILSAIESEPVKCNICGSNNLERMMSRFAFSVSGSANEISTDEPSSGSSNPCSGCTATSCAGCNIK